MLYIIQHYDKHQIIYLDNDRYLIFIYMIFEHWGLDSLSFCFYFELGILEII